MSETVPPSATLPAALPPQPQSTPQESAGRGTIVQLPPALTTPLPVGETLEAIVTARLAAARIAVTTRLGLFVLQTNLAPAQGTKLILQIASPGAQPAVTIAPYRQPSPPANAQENGAPAPATRNPVARNAAAQIGKAPSPMSRAPLTSVASAATTTTTSSPTTASSPTTDSATQVRGSVLNATVLRTFGRVAPQTTNARPLAAGNAPATSGLAPGTRLAFRLVAVTRPGTGAPPATPGTASQTGTVTGSDPAGNAIVRTNTAELVLSTPRPLPVGSNLLLQSVGRLLPLPADTASTHTLAMAPRWEALHQALHAVAAGTGPSTTAQAVPQPGPQFTGALMLFIATLRGGDLSGWLGQDATRSVENHGLLGRLADEFGAMQRLATEPGGQEWRLFLIPILTEGQLHQMRLFVRDRQAAAREGPADETRFVIEVNFSRLGPFQFDGLAGRKSLNLIIRTERDLQPHFQRSIAGIFDDTVAALGLYGSLKFRTESPFTLQPMRETGLLDDTGVVA